MLQAYIDNPSFAGDAVGAGDINLLVDNAHILDEETRRGRLAFDSRTRWMSDYTGTNGIVYDPGRIWWGSFQFRAGFATATILVYTTTGGPSAVVRFDGATVATVALSTGTTTITIDLTGRGYVDNQIIEVDVLRTSPNPANKAEVRDAYVGPVSGTVPFAWPGSGSAFTNNPSRAQLQDLSTAGNWVAQSLFNAREPLPMAVKFLDNLDQTGSARSLMAGTFVRDAHTDRFAITGYIQTPSANQETLRLLINGSIVASDTRNRGSYGPFTFDVDTTSLSTSALHTWELTAYTNTQGPEPRGRQYYSVHWALTRKNGLYANPFPLPPARQPQQSSSVAQWLDDLNRARLHYFDCYNRITASADTFNRVRMFSRRFDVVAYDEAYKNSYFALRYVPQGWRRGEGLWLRGQNVKLCFGGSTATPPDGKQQKLWTYTANNEISITESDKLETKYLAFDLISGLNPGDLYYLTGDVRGAFQVWRS